jgi:hypothetical protein
MDSRLRGNDDEVLLWIPACAGMTILVDFNSVERQSSVVRGAKDERQSSEQPE